MTASMIFAIWGATLLLGSGIWAAVAGWPRRAADCWCALGGGWIVGAAACGILVRALAAPSLAVKRDDAADVHASNRMSTMYTPGEKITIEYDARTISGVGRMTASSRVAYTAYNTQLIGNHSDFAFAFVSKSFEGEQPFRAHSLSRGARKGEQDSSVGSDPASACVADDCFETSRFTAAYLRDVSSIDAKDKFPFWVSRQRQLALTAFLGINLFKEHALFFLFFQSLTNCQSAMSQGRVPSWHLPRQKIGQNFRRRPVGHKCAELSCQRHQFCGRTFGTELGDRGDCEIKAGHAAATGV